MNKIILPKKIKFKKFYDKRGYLLEAFTKKRFNFNFQRSIISYSKKNVIRGLHFSKKPEFRLVYVIHGKINDFCVNLKNKSKKKFTLNANEGLIIPPHYAHGYECINNNNLIIYFLSFPYKKSNNVGILWNDKQLNIKWTISNPIISKNDKKLMTFENFIKKK